MQFVPPRRRVENRVVSIDQRLPVELCIRVESFTSVTYTLWIRGEGDQWNECGPEEIDASEQHRWLLLPKFGIANEVAYTMVALGCIDDEWRVRFEVRQRDGAVWDARASWTCGGSIDSNGGGGDWKALADAPRFVLSSVAQTVAVP